MNSSVRDEDILNFVSITGATPEAATNYLQVCDGNAENAITLYFENGGKDLVEASSSSRPPATSSSATTRPVAATNTTTRPPAPDDIWNIDSDEEENDLDYEDIEEDVIIPPPRNTNDPFPQLPRNRDAPRLRDDFENMPSASSSSRRQTASSSAATSRLDEIFAPPTDIMFRGHFQAARDHAKSHKKWLLVNILDQSDFQSLTWNRDIWRDPTIKDFLRDNFVFLQYKSDSEDGRNYKVYYPIRGTYTIDFIDPRTGERVKSWGGMTTASDFLQSCIDLMESQSGRANKKPKTDVTRLSEEDQLQLALAASMGETGSSSKTAKSKDVIVIDDDDDEDDEDVMEVASGDDDDEVQGDGGADQEDGGVSSVFQSISAREHPEPKTGDTTRIRLKMPDGRQITRAFLKSDKIRTLYEFVKHELLPQSETEQFEIFVMAPREGLLPKLDSTVKDANLMMASLIVEWL